MTWGADLRLTNSRTRVLVAEDDPILRSLIVALLESLGYAVVAVNHGGHAWRRLCAESFDVLLTDVEMPELGGLELAQRAVVAGLEIVIVVMSGREHYREAALEAGAALFVIKPFNVTELCLEFERIRAKAAS